jgi:hypothetical protein
MEDRLVGLDPDRTEPLLHSTHVVNPVSLFIVSQLHDDRAPCLLGPGLSLLERLLELTVDVAGLRLDDDRPLRVLPESGTSLPRER